MNTRIALLLLSIFLLSCERDPGPEIYPYFYIDVNADSIPDYQLYYWSVQTADVPASGHTTYVQFQPRNGNSILHHVQEGFVFLDYNDTIRKDGNEETSWNDSMNIDLYRFDWSDDLKNVQLNYTCENLLIGLKYSTADGEEIGWLEIEIDTLTSHNEVAHKAYTDQSLIIVKSTD